MAGDHDALLCYVPLMDVFRNSRNPADLQTFPPAALVGGHEILLRQVGDAFLDSYQGEGVSLGGQMVCLVSCVFARVAAAVGVFGLPVAASELASA